MKKIKLITTSMKEILRADPVRIAAGILNCIIQITYSLLVTILLLKLIFDAFFVQRSFSLILLYAGFQAGAQAFYYLYSEWYSNIYVKRSNCKIQEVIQLKIYNKYIRYDTIVFNDPQFYNKYNWVNANSARSMIGVYDDIINYIQSIVTLLLTGGIFIYYDPLIAATVTASVGIVFACRIKQNKNYYKKKKEIKDYSRYNDYVKRVFCLAKYRDDMKVYGIGSVLERLFEANHQKIIQEQRTANRRILGVEILMNIAGNLLGGNLPYIILGLKAILYDMYTVSEIAVLVNVIIKFRSSFHSVLSLVPQLEKNAMYLRDYYEFMDYEPEIKENEGGREAGSGANSLEIRNVSFTYGEGRKVLRNINLSIKAGEKIAIVGHNGAGKSTLIKLLLRLYLPQEGSIELDGIPAGEYRLDSYRGRFGAAFQDSVVYAASVADNVLMRPSGLPGDDAAVWEALERSGLKGQVERYPDGIDAVMTKEFDGGGIELSGGQAQKLALARVFARDSGIIILDEPSSALDPISEYEMYKNMLELSEGRTFIVISHRLSIGRDVDRIVLLDDGEIAECGSHKELLEKKGKYAKMWKLQAEQYS